ncbi:MAG: 3-keto-5-aminohexanoate cleavage protein, partial [Candidatus Bathyarchaeia archaeon]
MPPLIITCAITGGWQGKEANPNLPETPEEQAKSTFEAYEAGASIVHVHAR